MFLLLQDLRADREVVAAAVANNRAALVLASTELRSDPEFVRGACVSSALAAAAGASASVGERGLGLSSHSPGDRSSAAGANAAPMSSERQHEGEVALALWLSNPSLRGSLDCGLRAARSDGAATLARASDDLQGNRSLVLTAVGQGGQALGFAAQHLRSDRDIVLLAVSSCGSALRFTSKSLKADKAVVLAAVAHDGGALRFASGELRNDEDVVRRAITGGVLAAYADGDGGDPGGGGGGCGAFAQSPTAPSVLKWASEDIRSNRGVVLLAVARDHRALASAASGLQNDLEVRKAGKTLVLSTVQQP